MSLNLVDKLKTFVSAETGKLTDVMSFEKATAIEFKKLVKTKANAVCVYDLFQELCVSTCKDEIRKHILIA